MILYTEHQNWLNRFVKESYGDTQKNAIRAAQYAGITEDEYENFIVIRVDGYYNIIRVLDDNYPLELDNTVYPFDEKRIYPTQRIKQEIRYTTEY